VVLGLKKEPRGGYVVHDRAFRDLEAALRFMRDARKDMALIRLCIQDRCIVGWSAVHPDCEVMNMAIRCAPDDIESILNARMNEKILEAMKSFPRLMDDIVRAVESASASGYLEEGERFPLVGK